MPTVPWAASAVRHFRRADPVLAALAERYGPVPLRLGGDLFGELVSTVVGQQLSGKAAETIRRRLLAVVGDPPQPGRIARAGEEELREAGLSRGKVRTLRELAGLYLRGELPLAGLEELPDEEVVRRLTAVPGIGPWTALSFLLFALGRPDVLLAEDLGVRKGVQIAYGTADLPSPKAVRELARERGWHPFASAANWYLWRVKESGRPQAGAGSRRPPRGEQARGGGRGGPQKT